MVRFSRFKKCAVTVLSVAVLLCGGALADGIDERDSAILDGEALLALGKRYYRGDGGAHDAEAMRLFHASAERGHIPAYEMLIARYYYGRGVEQDMEQALKWSRAAADEGSPVGQYSLAGMYYAGEGVESDPARAVFWNHKAAEAGYAEAQYALGFIHLEGKGVGYDPAKAVSWFRKASQSGYVEAQYSLAVLYAEGVHVEKNSEEALHWYHLAADNGSVAAQYCLGMLYVNGGYNNMAVEKDEEKGIELLRRVVANPEKNSRLSKGAGEYALSLAYQQGIGVEQSIDEALFWMKASAVEGNPYAAEQVEELEWRRDVHAWMEKLAKVFAWGRTETY